MLKLTFIKGRIIKKVAVITLMIILFIFIVLTVLFQINKDKIARSLLLSANKIQNGELVFDDISFNPLIHFPSVSLVLNDIQYYEQKEAHGDKDRIPILWLEKLYIDFNLPNLVKGELSASNIRLENGKLNLIMHADGTLNLIKAMTLSKTVKKIDTTESRPKDSLPINDTLKREKPEPIIEKKKKDSVEEVNSAITLDLKNIILNKIEISYSDERTQLNSLYQLESVDASLQFRPDTIICAINVDMFIDTARIANEFSIESKRILLSTNLALNKDFSEIEIQPSKLVIGNASFLTEGFISTKDQGNIDMVVKGDDSDFGIFNLFLTNIGMDNIKKGDMFFDASIRGELFGKFPRVKGSFGINNVQINIPTTTHKVSELNLRGNFDSGDLDEFAGADFNITNLSAKLPKGNVKGHFKLDNFKEPRVDFDFSMKADIDGFEQLFELANIKDISGILNFKARFKGDYNLQDKQWNLEKGMSEIMLKNASLAISDELNIKNVNGKISFEKDVLSINNVKLTIGESNLMLNGSVGNPKMLFGKFSHSNEFLKGYYGTYFPIDTLVASQINIDFFSLAYADELKLIIPPSSLDSMSGSVEVKSMYSGVIDWEGNILENLDGETSVTINDGAFQIKGINKFKNINGSISLAGNYLYFNNLGIEYGKSDALLKGSLRNVHYVLFGIDKPIEGKLQIQSAIFDYPDFFSWDSFIASTFPYRIKDIELTVRPKTTTKNLVNFIRTPRIEFYIDQLDAEIENFLPPLSIKQGYFLLADKDSAVDLNFDDFEIEISKAKLLANVEILASPASTNWMEVQADFSNLNLKKTFTYWSNDTISEYFNGVLTGDASLDMKFGEDGYRFKKANIRSQELSFMNDVDTISISKLAINGMNIDYDSSSNLLETLSFKSELLADNMSIKNFTLDSLNYNIKADKGIFTIIPIVNQFFNNGASGLYVFNPFANPSSFKIKYKVGDFNIADLLKTFRDDPMMDGEMKLDIDIASTGDNQEEMMKNVSGYLSLYGTDLTLKGIDLDKLINRFKRSQRFTFADVGAVMLMGPAGILVTKGSDYTSMVVIDHDHVSKVLEFSSDYQFKNGLITFQDVALSTASNRLAINGTIDLKKDTLDLNIAVLNSKGCSIFSQSISGSTTKPIMGKVNAGKILLAPITNLAKKAVEIDCEVFYDGKVKDPKKNN